MLRRPCLCVLLLALTAGTAPAQTVMTSVQSGWMVEVRKPGASAWSDAGKFFTGPTAKGIASSMFRSGLQVRITKYTSLTLRHPTAPVPYNPATPTPPAQPLPPFPPPVSWTQAVDVFRKMEALGDRVAYRFPTDGCYARAHIMVQEMKRLGQQPWKVWSKQNGSEPLYAVTKNHPRGHVTWGWHVAPVLRVKLSNGKEIWCVFDPSLATRPSSLREWRKAQTRPGAAVRPIVEVTPLGWAPVWEGRRKGIGYTVADTVPQSSLDARAWATMREYKPFQGKWHPRLDKDAPTWVKTPAPAPTSKYYTGLLGAKSSLPTLGGKTPFDSLPLPAVKR